MADKLLQNKLEPNKVLFLVENECNRLFNSNTSRTLILSYSAAAASSTSASITQLTDFLYLKQIVKASAELNDTLRVNLTALIRKIY